MALLKYWVLELKSGIAAADLLVAPPAARFGMEIQGSTAIFAVNLKRIFKIIKTAK
jgi:hypothetical protein